MFLKIDRICADSWCMPTRVICLCLQWYWLEHAFVPDEVLYCKEGCTPFLRTCNLHSLCPRVISSPNFPRWPWSIVSHDIFERLRVMFFESRWMLSILRSSEVRALSPDRIICQYLRMRCTFVTNHISLKLRQLTWSRAELWPRVWSVKQQVCQLLLLNFQTLFLLLKAVLLAELRQLMGLIILICRVELD